MGSDDAPLTATGQLALTLDTDAKAGVPFSYTLEGDVEDVSRQHIANRTSLLVHPAPWYIGIKQMPLFVNQKRRAEDRARRGRPRRRAGAGRDDRRHADADPVDQRAQARKATASTPGTPSATKCRRASGTVTSASDAGAARHADFRPAATSCSRRAPTPGRGASPSRATSFYALGDGYTAWQRYDHNRIDLVARAQDLQAGRHRAHHDPVAVGTGDGARHHRARRHPHAPPVRADLDAAVDRRPDHRRGDIPNIYVSVLLVKGRTQRRSAAATGEAKTTPAIPGKPSFRLGYVRARRSRTRASA